MPKRIVEFLIFQSRWLLVPFYLGLVVAQTLYCYQFCVSLWDMAHHFLQLKDTEIMLGLIDITMIANLIKMIISGSYQSFVDKLSNDHSEKVSSGLLKVKMGTSLIGVSSIHLLQAFINASQVSNREVIIKVAIHCVFLFSTLGLAYIDYLHCLGAKAIESHDQETKH